jgi:hypothetical protein
MIRIGWLGVAAGFLSTLRSQRADRTTHTGLLAIWYLENLTLTEFNMGLCTKYLCYQIRCRNTSDKLFPFQEVQKYNNMYRLRIC